MDEGDSVPNATFSFTIEAGTAISTDTSDNAVMQVLPGVMVGTGANQKPSISDVTFAPNDPTATAVGTNIDVARVASERADGLTAATGVQLESGEKYATKTATIDFSGVTFDEPGIYRYVIRETASTTDEAAGIMHDNDTDRVLDVYVVDATDDSGKKLSIASIVMHTTEGNVTINSTMGSADVTNQLDALTDKTDGFTNEYNSKDLQFEKAVDGNQASRDKYFKFTVTLNNINKDDSYNVILTNAEASPTKNAATVYSTMTNPSTVSGQDLLDGQEFYLQHGQSIIIQGIAPNATYKVEEDAEDYSSAVMDGKVNETATGKTIKDVANANTANTKQAEAGFTNTRAGVIPTGVILSVAGLLVVGIIAVIGFVFFGIRSKKRYDED
ncbi:MAG: hypothetical protein J6O17_05220 [Eubacterium sp.]|nr:hypothetical protein [Eubacterium sp.]